MAARQFFVVQVFIGNDTILLPGLKAAEFLLWCIHKDFLKGMRENQPWQVVFLIPG